MSEWEDMIVGDRMTVDNEFTDRVQASQFSNQEWGLIMTATEFDIEAADDPDAARLVADTSAVESIMPELESIDAQRGPVAGGSEASNDGGLVETIKGAFGLGGGDADGVDQERLAAAESLAQAYADALQAHLESKETFEEIRTAYLD
ncbi:MAG: hypothetical protein J07HN4v3_00906 [Halonotius sp. J07HN4]|nr:MAG: hypothetical protein J07HN4v3_00906 [Halonotius sp. J07HN4]